MLAYIVIAVRNAEVQERITPELQAYLKTSWDKIKTDFMHLDVEATDCLWRLLDRHARTPISKIPGASPVDSARLAANLAKHQSKHQILQSLPSFSSLLL